MLLIRLVLVAVIWGIIRYGPINNRWRQYETPAGVSLCVGLIAFVVGFVGPIILTPSANQGPLLGIFYTGPLGLMGGYIWGRARESARARGGPPNVPG
ncbi:MAG: hypothetical protein ABI765_13850 [Gemmatimonadota bacterium]